MATTDVANADAAHDDHDHDDHDDVAVKAPAAAMPRGRNLQVGAAFFTGATLMYFGGLFAIYLSERIDFLSRSDDPWIPDAARVELTAPTVMAWTMLISIPTMHWAVWSFKRDDRRHGLIALLLQAIYAGAMINHHAFQWKQLGLVGDLTAADVAGGASNAPILIYAITISYVAALGIALVAFLLIGFRALSGASSRPHTDAAASVAVYWYALVAVYFVIWILIFITK